MADSCSEIYWASKILHHSSNFYPFSNIYGIRVWMGRSSQTDFMHQQWMCPVCCGGIHKNVKKHWFWPKNHLDFHRRFWLSYVCMMFVLRKTQSNLNWIVLWILVDFLNFLFNDLPNNRITWWIDLMAFKGNHPVIYSAKYPFQTNFTWSSYWF